MACAFAAAPSHRCGLASARRAGARRAVGAARPAPMVSLRRTGADLMVARVFSSDDEKEQPKLTREKEPEEYWKSEGERAGKSPMQDPLAIIGVVAIFFPFVLLGICAAFGLIDFSGGRG